MTADTTERPDRLDVECAAIEARSLALLIDWIVKANTLLDRISDAADNNNDLKRMLVEHHQIPYNNADRQAADMDNAMGYIVNRQITLIGIMAGAGGSA